MAIFPGSVATDAGLYVAVNNLSTLLTDNPLTIGATTVNVISTTGFPTAGAISIGAEIIFYTGITATSFTGCTRGADGTSAAAHALNDQVDHNVIAFHHNVLKDEIIALESFISTHLGLTTVVTAAEFERLSGVTSPIQTQLNGKEPTITVLTVAKGGTNSGAALSNNRIIRSLGGAIVEAAAITANRAVVSDADGIPVHSDTTAGQIGSISLLTPDRVPYINGGGNFESSPISSAELAFLDNVTSNVQTQLDGKVNDTGDTMTGDLDMSSNDIRRVATLNDTFLSGFRNRVPNGEMRFDQRNGGATYTLNAASTRNLDCWVATGIAAAGVMSLARTTTTPPTGFSHYMRLTVTTADASLAATDRYVIDTRIEGSSMRDMLFGSADAKQVTLSFWVRSSLTGTFGGSFMNDVNNRSYVFSYTINAANTWEKKTITLTGDTAGTWQNVDGQMGIVIHWSLGVGSNFQKAAGAWGAGQTYSFSGETALISTNAATFDLTGVQFEIGGAASHFEHLDTQVGLARVQRYIEKSYALDTALATNTTTNAMRIACTQAGGGTRTIGARAFMVQKAVTPTITLYAPDGTTGNLEWLTTGGSVNERAATVSLPGTQQFTVFRDENVAAAEYIATGHFFATAEF